MCQTANPSWLCTLLPFSTGEHRAEYQTINLIEIKQIAQKRYAQKSMSLLGEIMDGPAVLALRHPQPGVKKNKNSSTNSKTT